MAKKATKPAEATDQQPDPTNSTEPTPNSAPLDEAQANPNAATGDESDQTNQDEPTVPNEAPAPDDVNDPEVQQAQPEEAPEDPTPSPTTEADLTHAGEDATTLVPAGTADATADHTADGQHNDTLNTHPQSDLHEGDLSDEEKDALVEEYNEAGAIVGRIAAKYNVTPERVHQIVDEHNADRDDEADE